jgi:hypothetical protein
MSSRIGASTDPLLAALLAAVVTVADAHARVRELRDMLAHARFGGAAAPEAAAAVAAVWGEPAVAALAREDAASARAEALASLVDGLPVLVLYVPAALSPAAIEQLGRWCRAHVREDVLLDVRIDPSSAGGCIIAWQDHLHDYSFAARFKDERGAVARSISARLSGQI